MTSRKSADRSRTTDCAGFQQNGSQSCKNPAEFTMEFTRENMLPRDSRIPCGL